MHYFFLSDVFRLQFYVPRLCQMLLLSYSRMLFCRVYAGLFPSVLYCSTCDIKRRNEDPCFCASCAGSTWMAGAYMCGMIHFCLCGLGRLEAFEFMLVWQCYWLLPLLPSFMQHFSVRIIFAFQPRPRKLCPWLLKTNTRGKRYMRQ